MMMHKWNFLMVSPFCDSSRTHLYLVKAINFKSPQITVFWKLNDDEDLSSEANVETLRFKGHTKISLEHVVKKYVTLNN